MGGGLVGGPGGTVAVEIARESEVPGVTTAPAIADDWFGPGDPLELPKAAAIAVFGWPVVICRGETSHRLLEGNNFVTGYVACTRSISQQSNHFAASILQMDASTKDKECSSRSQTANDLLRWRPLGEGRAVRKYKNMSLGRSTLVRKALVQCSHSRKQESSNVFGSNPYTFLGTTGSQRNQCASQTWGVYLQQERSQLHRSTLRGIEPQWGTWCAASWTTITGAVGIRMWERRELGILCWWTTWA